MIPAILAGAFGLWIMYLSFFAVSDEQKEINEWAIEELRALRPTECDEIKTEVMALGRKGAEAWCLQQVIAYDPELSQLELDTAYKNLKNMDLNELGDAIVEMDAL